MITQSQYDAVRKNLDRTRALKNQCEFQANVWKEIALSGVQITKECGEKIIATIMTYEGSSSDFEGLSLPGKLLTAIAWNNYPDKSFTALVDKIAKVHPELSKTISNYGADLRVLSAGDTTKASGWRNPYLIFVDTEEWHQGIPNAKRIWQQDDELYEQVSDAMAEFAGDTANEVKASLLKDFNLSLEELYKLLG